MSKRLNPIRNVSEFLQFLELHDEPGLRHGRKRIWYRGQADGAWPLTPKVYRPGFMEEGIVDNDGKERRTKERHLTQDFEAFSALLVGRARDNFEIYCLQQHYGMPTRLLDWTTNPLVALYFASEATIPDTDGMVYRMDAYNFPKVEGRGVGIATSRSPLVQEILDEIFRWQGPKRKDLPIIPVRPGHFDHRIGLQYGCFTLHGPNCKEVNLESNSTLLNVKVISDRKQAIREQLNSLAINDFTAYGDLEHLARKLKKDYGCS